MGHSLTLSGDGPAEAKAVIGTLKQLAISPDALSNLTFEVQTEEGFSLDGTGTDSASAFTTLTALATNPSTISYLFLELEMDEPVGGPLVAAATGNATEAETESETGLATLFDSVEDGDTGTNAATDGGVTTQSSPASTPTPTGDETDADNDETDATDGETYADTIEDLPQISPDTQRYSLAAYLYQHPDDSFTVGKLTETAADTSWSMSSSAASGYLFKLHQQGIVDRRDPDDGPLEYWITDRGRTVLEAVTSADREIAPGTNN